MTTALYVPGTSEKDMSKVIMSAQLVAGQTATNTDAITTANANIATNTTNIATNTTAITALQVLVPSPKITNSLSGDVAMNNIANYFDGPSIAQGTTGTWFASGTVTVTDTGGAANINCKLWDGTTVIASAQGLVIAAGDQTTVSLSGYLAAPAANIRISCNDSSHTTGKILFNASGNSKDSTISAYRIA